MALLIVSSILFAGAGNGQSQTNSWINPGSGNWEDASWSLGAPPGPNQTILITNAGWKAISIGPNTASHFPQTLTVDSLTISSPTNTVNTLLMNFVGVGSPLVANSVTLNENSIITLHSSALEVSSNMSIGGTFNQNDFSGVSAATLQIGDVGPAVYTMSNGTLTVTTLEVLGGWGHSAIFDQEGGYHLANPLWISAGGGEYDLHSGQLGGNVLMKGGILNQSGGDLALSAFSVNGFYNLTGGTLEAPAGLTVYQGSVTQSGGTNSSGSFLLGSLDYGNFGSGSYTLSNGVMNVSNVTINYLGGLDLEGGILNVTGGLNMTAYLVPPAPGYLAGGHFVMNHGMVSAGSFNFQGYIVQNGGTNAVTGDLTAQFYQSSYALNGGLLTTSNTIPSISDFYQSGGIHEVKNFLRVTSPLGYNLSSGQLIASNIDIIGTRFLHSSGSVSNSGALILDTGHWIEQTASQQFGRLQLSGSSGSLSDLQLATGPCVVQFADSSSQAWTNGAMLKIDNWTGSINGGGQSQVFFGNSSSGLSASQLAQIQFHFPQGDYPAKLLSSGEIVPIPTGPPFTPSDLSARASSSNQIDLTWTDNAFNETGYLVERSSDGSLFAPIAILPPNATNYSDHGLSSGIRYWYQVLARGTNGDSYPSNDAFATTKIATPISGMIAWWRGEGAADDAIGTHDGYVPSAINYPSGKVGQAFDFPGLGQRIIVTDSPDFVLTNALSIEGWIYPRQSSSGVVSMRGDARAGYDAWALDMAHTPGNLSFFIQNESNDFVEIEAPVQTGQWQHFAATFDTTNGLRLFINGTLAAQTNTLLRPIGILDPTQQPAIGIGNSGIDNDDFSFNGLLDEIALYSRALSPGEIQSIYNAGGSGKLGIATTMNLAPQANGAMQLNLNGLAGHSYEIDVGTDLVHWVPWKTQLLNSGALSITDDSATNSPMKFYRTVPLP